MRYLRVKSRWLRGIDDTVLCPRHDNNWESQFLIVLPHGHGTWNHGDAVLTLRANLPGP